jgi:hypothetical protein
LFGAGSGNVLTKITKYATIIFFALALFLGYLQDQVHSKNSASQFEKQVQQKQMETPAGQPSLPAAMPPPALGTNSLLSVPLTTPDNAPTNPSAAPPQSK